MFCQMFSLTIIKVSSKPRFLMEAFMPSPTIWCLSFATYFDHKKNYLTFC